MSKQTMRVGLISYHSFFQPGGVKSQVFGLQKELKRKRIYSRIIAPRRKRIEDYGKDVILLGTSFPFPFGGTQADFGISFNPFGIEKTLKKERFDILHFHNFGLSALQILERSDSLNILTFHASLEGSKFLERFSASLKILERIIQWKVDGIIGVAPFHLKYFKNYSGPKILIPNGIDLEKFNPSAPQLKNINFLSKKNKVNILFLGRIEKRKGLIYLLKAYKILQKNFSNLNLIVAGEGPLRKDLERWTKINKLDNVIFVGKIDEEKTPSYYRSCDIFCAPSIFGESFGLVLLEAMASAKPVVAFANEGYKGVLTGKGARFLAKPGDYKALAEKLRILIKNETLRKEMGEWGINEAQKYDFPKLADRVLNFYEVCRQAKEKQLKKRA